MTLVTFAVPFESAAFRRRPVSHSVRIVHTGVGADAARIALERALVESLPDRVIVSGFAGALVPGFRIGEVVSDTANSPWRHARFAMAAEVLEGPSEKRVFQSRTGAEVVDMESDAIREVCTAAGVPLAMVRAISDGAEDDLGLPPALLAALAAGPVKAFPQLVWTLLASSRRRTSFLRLVRDCRTAQRALASALEKELISAPAA